MRRMRGFTLIELAFVIAIGGLIFGFALSALTTLQTNSRLSAARSSNESVLVALRSFAVRNRRLPCPAPPFLEPGESGYGLEAACTGTASLYPCDTAVPPDAPPDGRAWCITVDTGAPFDNVEIHFGALPYQTLGLPRRSSLDPWRNQLGYVVVDGAVQEDSLTAANWEPVLNLLDAPGGTVLVGNGVLALFSSGPNENGALTELGNLLDGPPAGANAELENLDGDNVLVDTAYSEAADEPFDDLVLMASEDHILSPMEVAGATRGKTAQTWDKLRRIERALTAFAVVPEAGVDPDLAPDPDGCSCDTTSPNFPQAWCVAEAAGGGAPPSCTACDTGCVRTALHRLPWADDGDADAAENNGVSVGNIPSDDLDVNANDSVDAWGSRIRYRLSAELAQNTDTGGLYSGAVGLDPQRDFTVWSLGPNLTDDGCGAGTDDLCIRKPAGAMVGELISSGVRLD